MKQKITYFLFWKKGFDNQFEKVLLLIVSLFVLFSSTAFSQVAKFNFKLNGVTVKDVFKQIELQSNYVIICNEDFVDVERKVNLDIKNQPIEFVLSKLFEGTDNTFTLRERQIVITVILKNEAAEIIKPKEPLPKQTASGVVVDMNNSALQGVTVFAKDFLKGTITDAQGKFELTIPGEAKMLIFSSIGMKRKEVIINNNSTFKIVMSEENYAMNELVVVAYGIQNKLSVTGAIGSVNTNEMVKSPTSSVQNALAGRTPGLTIIQQSGAPGADYSDIYIRGRATYGNARPLILVDGIERDITTIDPNEIDLINVLKDASATAVFGVRGANGVIIVTTKTGSDASAPKISFTANYGFSSPTRIPRFLNSAEYAHFTNVGARNDERTSEFPDAPSTFIEPFSKQDIALYKSGEDPIFHPNNDWTKILLKNNAPQNNYNINISGGTSKIKYFISLGYFSQDGIFGGLQVYDDLPVNSKINRYNVRSNTDFQWSKNFSTSLKISTQISDGLNSNLIAGSDNVLHSIWSQNPISSIPLYQNKIIVATNEIKIFSNNDNPFFLYNRDYTTQYKSRSSIDLSMKYKLDIIAKGLSLNGKFAYDNYYQHDAAFNRTNDMYEIRRIAPGNTGNYFTLVQTSFESPFISSQSLSSNYRLYSEASVNYTHTFSKSHSFSALLLGTMERYFRGGSPALPYNYLGLVGRTTYDYKKKYLMELNIGFNGSENFMKGNQFGFFPAYSLGYVISEEDFFPKGMPISFLKLRGSLGKVGNDKIGGGRFLFTPSYYSYVAPASGDIRFGEANELPIGFYKEGKIGNPNISWEVAVKSNLGFEMKFFDNKLNLIADFFNENRKGILDNYKNVSYTFGDLSILPSYNLGSVENKGFELEIGYQSFPRHKFQYWINANYSYARNKILNFDEVKPEYPNLVRTGKPIGQPFMLLSNGFFNTWEEVNDPNRIHTKWENNVQPGDLKYIDVNGDDFIDENDMTAVGYGSVPEITYGINFGISWNNFDISTLIQGADHVSNFYSSPILYTLKWAARTEADYDAWTAEKYANGEKILFPRVGNGATSANSQTNSYLNQDAAFLRLKNIEIGYSIERKYIKFLGCEELRVYFNAQNLATFSKMKYWDPESVRNTDRQYPINRTLNFGLKASF
jgi:TonB-linked SusC/RagA family outer membrane protein